MAGVSPQGEDGASAAASNSRTPADQSVAPAHPHPAAAGEGGHVKAGKWGLIIGAIGVVFGDIGTSPLYALREAIGHAREGVGGDLAVIGVVSLAFWALMIVVTFKYVMFLMRADNKGEGGTLALMALAQRALSKRSGVVLFLGMVGAALFYGDGVITPAISVLSATEGLKVAAPGLKSAVVPLAVIILIGLYFFLTGGRYEATDDAYVDIAKAPVAASVAAATTLARQPAVPAAPTAFSGAAPAQPAVQVDPRGVEDGRDWHRRIEPRNAADQVSGHRDGSRDARARVARDWLRGERAGGAHVDGHVEIVRGQHHGLGDAAAGNGRRREGGRGGGARHLFDGGADLLAGACRGG
jgi:hypothetical protein